MKPTLLPIEYNPVMLDCLVNNVHISFEVDSGSFLSTINENELGKLNNVNILPTQKRAKGYSNNVIKFRGEVELCISFKGFEIIHKFLIVNRDSISLLGRDLCRKLNIQFMIPSGESINNVKSNILSRYEKYLSDDFKSSVQDKISFDISSDTVPIFCKARTVPVRYKELVRVELKRLLDSGIIRKVFNSKWACPTVNVLKANGQIRICGDYSLTINRCMTTVQYPVPNIDDVIANVGNAKYFSKLDLQQAYLQLPLDDDSKEYTTINTGEGLYQFNYLPFGVSSSPAIFQSYVTRVLSGINNIVVYHDDILVLTPTVEDHECVLDRVLNVLMSAGIKLNSNKCSFFTQSVSYLGYVFSSNGVQPNEDKVRAIHDAPAPVNIKQLQSFIGLCTFYSRFIHNFSDTLSPFYKLLKKGRKFQWGEEQIDCFNKIKNMFKSSNILRSFNSKLPTAIETDASATGIGAVLMQEHEDGWQPVQFASRTLNPAECNYSQIEREALSVIFGCERFKKFLLGAMFLIKNDHKPLMKLFSNTSGVPATCSARLQRWALRLSQFKYNFQYVKGASQYTSDFLSRLPLPETAYPDEPRELIFVINSLNEYPISCSDICTYTNLDSNLRMVKEYIKYGFPVDVHSSLSKFKSNSEDMSIVKGCIMYRNRVFIPQPLRSKVLAQLHSCHPGISGMKSLARALIWYPGIDRDIVDLVRNCKQCQSVLAKPAQNSNIDWPKPNRKWSRVHVDHFFFHNKIFFIVIDALTKYIECEIVSSTSSNVTIEILRQIFSRNGLPDLIVSDNATSFTSLEFKEFLEANGIHHLTPPPYSPSSNGQAERAVRVIKDLLKKNILGSLQSRLSSVLLYYRNVPHSVTQISPSVALNGRNLITVNDRLNPFFVPSIKKKVKGVVGFNVGDSVLALNLAGGPKWYQATILDKVGDNIYNVHIHQLDVTWKRHKHQLLALPNNTKASSSEVVVPHGHSDNCTFAPPVTSSNVCPSPAHVSAETLSESDSSLRRSSRMRNSVNKYDPS